MLLINGKLQYQVKDLKKALENVGDDVLVWAVLNDKDKRLVHTIEGDPESWDLKLHLEDELEQAEARKDFAQPTYYSDNKLDQKTIKKYKNKCEERGREQIRKVLKNGYANS